MTTTAILLRFDYGSLAGGVATEVARRTRDIKVHTQRAAEDIVRIGAGLKAVKAALPHGRFGEWLRAEFAWTERHAQRLMSVAEKFDPDTVSDLEFAPTALYLLSSDEVPEPARVEAITQAKAGVPLTKAAAKTIVAKHTATTTVTAESETVSLLAPADAFYDGDPDDEPTPEEKLADAQSPYRRLVRLVGELKSLPESIAGDDPIFAAWFDSIRQDEWLRRCKNLQAVAQAAEPHGVCGYCGGDGCKTCRSTGFLPHAMAASAPQLAG